MTTNIKPTNTCFDDALDFFDDLRRAGEDVHEPGGVPALHKMLMRTAGFTRSLPAGELLAELNRA